MKQYFRDRIEALQFDGKNHEAIAVWVAHQGKKDKINFVEGKLYWSGFGGENIRVYYLDGGEIKRKFNSLPQIQITDWLVRRKGRFEIFPDEIMNEYFVPAGFKL